MNNQLSGKVVAVTGGANGIGREIAKQLAAAGARVAIGDKDGAGARRTADELPGDVSGFDLDVTDTESFTAFLSDVEAQQGPLDVLVNNAGVMWVGNFDEEPESATALQLNVNLHGPIRGVKLAAPKMRARGRGQIVTVASAASKLAPPGESSYAATKHGILGYLTGVREELHGSGVELSVVMPTVVDTELAAGTVSGSAKMLQPEDVAKAVVEVIVKPKFEVMVPAYVGPAVRWANVLPQKVRDFVLRKMVPNQVKSADHSARASYEARVVTNKNEGSK
ncbi:MAG: SDR family oxidoreductase [Rhodococcus sp.]|nr:SDR family oxidoreductase [Rhodococcus sp. (in: high G+C Gram-positive bacteria)]